MTDREIVAVMADVYNRLYGTSFHGEQVHVISDCMKMLLAAIKTLNQVKEPSVPNDGNHDQPAP